jgi:hypothetical protein
MLIFQERSSTHVVLAVDGARFAAMQMASLTGKGAYGHGSA